MFISNKLPDNAAAGGVGTPLGELLLYNESAVEGVAAGIYRVWGTRNLPPGSLAPHSSQVMKTETPKETTCWATQPLGGGSTGIPSWALGVPEAPPLGERGGSSVSCSDSH